MPTEYPIVGLHRMGLWFAYARLRDPENIGVHLTAATVVIRSQL